jgi:hypothetical protein
MDLPLFLYPCYRYIEYYLSHQYLYFRWPTQGTVWPPTTLKTMGRTTTKTPTHRHPLRLLLSKCWLCKHKCFRPCSRPWSTCMHNPKRHRRWGIGWEIFNALSRQPFLMLWSQWMLITSWNLLRRSCRWCHATSEKVLLASHQFSGPTVDWWYAYVEAHEEPESINWLEFRVALCAHHVPQRVIKLKKNELHDLK